MSRNFRHRNDSAASPSSGHQGRMIIAFGFFVALLAVFGGALLYKSDVFSIKNPLPGISSKARLTLKSGKSFFYDRIGEGALAPATQAAQQSGRDTFTLEIKVTNNRSEAEALIDSLQTDGIEAYYTPLNRDGRVVYRVRKGLFTTEQDASAAAVALKKDTGIGTRVTKLQ